MDKNNIIHEHSKIKLELYRLYLQRYLSILLVTTAFNNIDIYDIFAGCGISDNDEEGSAIIAAKFIKQAIETKNKNNKTINLKLNEYKEKNCIQLREHLKDFDFASVSCEDANVFINKWQPSFNTHNLFFIDPYGYTQIGTKNLETLFKTRNCDFLIFIPLSHIYRFLKLADSSEVDKKYYEPIAKFLEGLGIDKSTVETVDCPEDFAATITYAFRNISQSKYVYYQLLENENKNNKYALFFVSHHILGAEKFLEAQKEVRKSQSEKEYKDTLFQDDNTFILNLIKNTSSVLDFIDYQCSYDNVVLYELGIKHGFLPSELIKQLKDLEKIGKIKVATIAGEQRNRGGFYINSKHYKNKNRIITVRFME